MIKGIIFDLDGVLVFTDKYHYQAWKQIADEEGIVFNEEINNQLRGISRMESLEIILKNGNKEYSKQEKEALCEKKNNIYVELLDNLTPDSIDKESRDVIEFLKKSDIKLAVGSVSKNTIKILTKTDLLKYFDVVIDGNEITHSKPDPEVFIKAFEGLNLKKEECLVIEDAVAGIKAGNAAGIKTVGIQDASKYEGCTYHINKLKDIIDIASQGIVIKNLGKIYPNGHEAVKDFNLEIDDQEFVVFVGPSGCGKSTVLRMIAGLSEITSGELYIDGVLSNNKESKDRNIAMVFQNYALYPHLSVRDNIGFPLLNERIPWKYKFDFKWRKNRRQEINKKVEEVAKIIGLSEYLDRKPKFLSGGQRQRVALGRAIIRNPRCFLLDEPLSNLDAKMRASMRTEISKLHQDLKKTFIYVTHDQVEAMTMGSKIVVMKLGVIQQVDSPSELYNHPKNLFAASFIGSPQMNFINVKLEKEDNKLILKHKEFKLVIPDKFQDVIDKNYINQEIIMGIRPKAVKSEYDLEFDVNNNVEVRIALAERLGDETLLYTHLNNDEHEIILSSTADNEYQINDKIKISFNLKHLCLFDKQTECSIIDYNLINN